MRFEISFHGHKNVRSLHPKSIEITTDSDLTVNGDYIVGVGASCGCLGIPEKMKKLLQDPQSEVTCTILVGEHSYKITGRGSDKLSLKNPHDIVIRKSNFMSKNFVNWMRYCIRFNSSPNDKGITESRNKRNFQNRSKMRKTIFAQATGHCFQTL